MGFFDAMKTDKLGKQAYNAHVQANDLQRRGKVADARKKYDEALELYRQAYDAGCRKTGILMSYSVLMMRYGMFAEARELMKEISAIGGMSEEVHFELRVNYSICLWRLGILDEAIKTIDYASKYARNSSYFSSACTYYVERAAKSGEEADFEAARALLDEAMDYDDEDAATLDNYGEYFRCLCEREADPERKAELRKFAVDYYERAYKQKPSQITTLYALANFAREDGNLQRARELVDKALLHSSSRVCPVSPEMLKELKAQLG